MKNKMTALQGELDDANKGLAKQEQQIEKTKEENNKVEAEVEEMKIKVDALKT